MIMENGGHFFPLYVGKLLHQMPKNVLKSILRVIQKTHDILLKKKKKREVLILN